MSRTAGRGPRRLIRWWRRRSLRARLTVIAATAIAVSVFVAFQVASELLAWQLRDTVEEQLRADARVLAANAERAGPAQVELPPYPGSGRLVRVILPDGSIRTPAGQPVLPPVSENAGRVARGTSADLLESNGGDEEGYAIYTLRAGDGAVQVARAVDDGPVNQFGFGMLLIGLLCVAGGALVGRTVARTGLAPIDRLTSAAVRVAHTRELDADIPDEGGGEIRRLIQSINDMLAALRDSRQAQRLLAEDAAHELKTPLTSLRLNVELLIRLDRRGTLDSALPAESRTRLLNDLGAQVAELSTLVAELTDLARGDVSDESTEVLDFADVVAAAATRAESRMPDIEVALDVTSVWVNGRPAALERAVLNLIDNAGKWSPADQPVQVRLRTEGESVVLEVDDGGPGIDAADIPRLFDRFYRADSARGLPGSGLGLSIVQRVVDAHAGRATVARSARGGALLRVVLPAAASPTPIARPTTGEDTATS
ncbi:MULTISPECIES: HAMP domain-containing sensor histidine kinase [Streptomyces]|uniref:HAMP domain-containing sensor histidine kinase n=1 Tax=Streptomyces TaxID=1883 RepID=UPI000D0C890B|nr:MULTISPECIES: HAMP domain-containing sensor histidine kinase [Streptomyces]MDX3364504.1 HAMP domain-containing sensor histidine kinase [Streptomyces sp. ME02-6987-2C]MDX3401523.1 HAMP domain-containing sensor histidine kinase [Streptomyces sp. ME01-18h]MDX3425911.1 HAMP domain-containing sensor histidine kinase [Streptomyces sp. ME02-6985-2c]WTE16812.1 HAMP domain-containing histidine kinase [Streptomyces anthocyanicus]